MEFLDTLEATRQQGMAPPAPSSADDCVTIMSIHKSKGLEFPVVFLSDLSRRFNLEDTRQPVLVHQSLGVGAYVLDRETLVRYPTIARNVIAMEQKKETISEELRVLYVAMTRPKSRLIMTMCKKKLTKEIEKLAADAALPMPVELSASAGALGDWVLMAALCRTEAGQLHAIARPEETTMGPWPWDIHFYEASDLRPAEAAAGETQPLAVPTVEVPDRETVAAAMAYTYPYLADTLIPSKLTATQLKGRSLDQEAAEDAATEELPAVHVSKPQFRQGLRELTAAEKGTATHLVMQFADFSACTTEEGVRQEIDRLVDREFITQQQADAVRPQTITAFFASELGQRVLMASQLVREFKFSMLVPATDYYPDGTGEILLQGVVDCCLVEDDGLTILDFKTDAVTADTVQEKAAYYRGQLDAYAAALERIFEKPVKERVLYFFRTNTAVHV
jgi:ATP-dependent helicase/nuclease subunit A